MIIEVNEAGELVVPAELVQSNPHTRLEANREGAALILRPVGVLSRRRLNLRALPVLSGGLSNPEMTFRREDIYDGDAR